MLRRIPLFWTIILTFLGAYLLLLYGVPYLSMLIAGREGPLPIPGALMGIYLALIVTGLLVYLAADEARLEEFWAPVDSFLRGRPEVRTRGERLFNVVRQGVFTALPLLIGGAVYLNIAPSAKPPPALRIQHPTIPFEYEKLTNPYRNPDGTVDPAILEEGRVLYQINCRPCHGTPANGNGPMAYGFRLRPANFRSEDTIATVIESYAFWRVKEGGISLPAEGSPWDSAMPAWKDELTDDQIWKIIAAEYAIAGVEPRRPETLPESRLVPAEAMRGAFFGNPIPANAQAQVNGETIYQERCAFCHGENGDGNGPVAPYLSPRPRDFTSGQFRFRTTASGELPLREDVISIIKNGVHGTAMPAWENILTQAEIEAVVNYLTQNFVPGWGSYEPLLIPIPRPPRVTQAMIEDGAQIYQDLQCWRCHGQAGRADGPSAPTLTDDLGSPIRAADLTQAWRYKGGSDLAAIYARFSTGMNGTPMPSFYDVFPEEEREDKLWALSAYVRSLQAGQPTETSVIVASRISGTLPTGPEDPAWEQARPVSFYLTGQVIAGPRWQTPAVSAVTLRALHNDQSLALLVEWNDPFNDEEAGGSEGEVGEDTYINLEEFMGTAGPFPDALAVQFPQSLSRGTQKPHFFWGQPGQPVNVWKWQADVSVAEYNAAGFQNGLQPQSAKQATADATWVDGRYRLIFTRSLTTDDPNDVQLVTGEFIPIAFQAWEGSNGETGLRLSQSSWYSLLLEKPVPMSVYAYTALAMIGVAAAEWALVRRARRKS